MIVMPDGDVLGSPSEMPALGCQSTPRSGRGGELFLGRAGGEIGYRPRGIASRFPGGDRTARDE